MDQRFGAPRSREREFQSSSCHIPLPSRLQIRRHILLKGLVGGPDVDGFSDVSDDLLCLQAVAGDESHSDLVALDRTTLSQLAEPGDNDTAGSLREYSFGFG